MNISTSQKPFVQEMFKQCVIKNLNLGYRFQVMGLGSWSWVFDPGFQILGPGPFSSYYKVWHEIITRCSRYYKVWQKVVTKCDRYYKVR